MTLLKKKKVKHACVPVCLCELFCAVADWRLDFWEKKERVFVFHGVGATYSPLYRISRTRRLHFSKGWAKLKTFPWSLTYWCTCCPQALIPVDLLGHVSDLDGEACWRQFCGPQATCYPGNPGCPVLWKWFVGNSSCSGPQLAPALMDFILTFLFYGPHHI